MLAIARGSGEVPWYFYFGIVKQYRLGEYQMAELNILILVLEHLRKTDEEMREAEKEAD